MGFFTNIIIAGGIERRNNRQIKRRRTWFDTAGSFDEAQNILVFGGADGDQGPRAQRFRMDLIDRCIEHAEDNGCATILLARASDADAIEAILSADDAVLRVGTDIAWQLFDARNRPSEVRQMFEEILWAYCRGSGNAYDELLSWINYFIDLMNACLPEDFFTYPNMDMMVKRLIRINETSDTWDGYHSIEQFLNWIEQETRSSVPGDMRRRLSALWSKGLDRLTLFWNAMADETRAMSAAYAAHGSFNDHLRRGGVCTCLVPDSGHDVATAILLAQLRAVGRLGASICLIDYRVKLPAVRNQRLLNDISNQEYCCIIGHNPRSMGIVGDEINFTQQTMMVCLGMANIMDTQAVSGMMSGISRVVTPRLSLGHGSFLGLEKGEQSDIPQDQLRLENCPDGQAVIRDAKGYRVVRHIVA